MPRPSIETIVKDLSTMPDAPKKKRVSPRTAQQVTKTRALTAALQVFGSYKKVADTIGMGDTTLMNYMAAGQMPLFVKYACLGAMKKPIPDESAAHILVIKVPTTQANLIHKILEAAGATIYGDIPV